MACYTIKIFIANGFDECFNCMSRFILILLYDINPLEK